MIRDGQNIFDVCLQHFGTLENIFDIVNTNNLTLSSNLNSGQELNIDSFNKGNNKVKNYINERNITPANSINYASFIYGAEFSLTADTDMISADTDLFTADMTGMSTFIESVTYIVQFEYSTIFVSNVNIGDENINVVKDRQNIFDVTLQYFGGIENIFNWLNNNNLTLNSFLNSGQQLNIDNLNLGDQEIKDFISQRKLIIMNDTSYQTTSDNEAITADSDMITVDTTDITADTI